MASADATAESAAPGITNTQEAGVDEGDIVKLRGDVLVILRRGRLFTVSIAHGGMQPVDRIDASPPGVGGGAWYDEMLVQGDRVIVIGYSYARGGTEITRFHIADDGRLRFEDAYQLRSNDYYSSRNYASRLIGRQLTFYSPLYIPAEGDPLEGLPSLRRWSGDASAGFKRIAGAQQVFIPAILRDSPDVQIEALHTVTSCDLAAAVLACSAMSVLGPDSRTFYVSPRAVYVWVTEAWQRNEKGERASSLLYRLPVDGSRPSAVGVRGAPVDQFSFREDAADGMLNVLVRSDTAGDAMWRPEFSEGFVALLRLPLAEFGNGSHEVEAARYRTLPRPGGDEDSFHDRFVGDYLLYGIGNGWGEPRARGGELTVVPIRGGETTRLALGHGVDRIEAVGRDALVVGSDANAMTLSSIELASGAAPRIGDRYVQSASSEAETRSHGFFYLPDATSRDGSSGVLGLPIAQPARPAYRQLFDSSVAMIFLRRSERHFAPLGALAAQSEGVVDDDCQTSCTDWYGNARPILLHGRTFALMGYEIVEGRMTRNAIQEIARVNFAPKAGVARRSEAP